MEFALKALIELNGEKYVANHDIRAQLNKLQSLGVDVPHKEELRNMALTINSWEVESCYKDSFVAAMDEVEKVMQYTEDIIRYIETFITKDECERINAFA